ncbi:MAG: hypothetical protein WCX70_01150 [Candidatus Paceibacterota bacterium]|jgi:hypothetical protein
MDEEIKQLLVKNIELGENNKQILTKILRYQRNIQILATLKWLLIILSAVGAFYYLQPFWDSLLSSYKNLIEIFNTIDINNVGFTL